MEKESRACAILAFCQSLRNIELQWIICKEDKVKIG